MRLKILFFSLCLPLAGCGDKTMPAPAGPQANDDTVTAQSAASQAGGDTMPTITPADLAPLTGEDWTGELTYLDYGDNETELTIPAELFVVQSERTFGLYFSFPEKPDAGGGADVTISGDGRKLNDETVTRREETETGLIIATTQACEDNGVAATCAFTYDISPNAFSIRKLVTPDGENEAFQRHLYNFTR